MTEFKAMPMSASFALRWFFDYCIEQLNFLVVSAVIAYKVCYFHVWIYIGSPYDYALKCYKSIDILRPKVFDLNDLVNMIKRNLQVSHPNPFLIDLLLRDLLFGCLDKELLI